MCSTQLQTLLFLYPEYTSVLGPYLRKDGRKHVVLNNSLLPKGAPGKLKTISYPKALIEIEKNSTLLTNETVDHIDCDFTNNDLSNLRVLPRNIHCKQDAIRYNDTTVNCLYCGAIIELTGPQVKTLVSNAHRGKVGPFCGKTCSGRYGKDVQMGVPPRFVDLDKHKITKSKHKVIKPD